MAGPCDRRTWVSGERQGSWRRSGDLEKQGLDHPGEEFALFGYSTSQCMFTQGHSDWASAKLPLWESRPDKMVSWSQWEEVDG